MLMHQQFVSNWSKAQKMCNTAIDTPSCAIKFLPDNYKTQEMCDKTVFSDRFRSLS